MRLFKGTKHGDIVEHDEDTHSSGRSRRTRFISTHASTNALENDHTPKSDPLEAEKTSPLMYQLMQETPREKKWYHTHRLKLALLLLLAGILIIATSLWLSRRGSKADRLTSARKIVRHISDESTLNDQQSPQYRALQWVAEEDEVSSSLDDYDRITQRYILAVLFYSTGGEHWESDLNFLSRSNECMYWYRRDNSKNLHGVSACKDGHVTELDLSSNGLSGRIPKELSKLKYLKRLSLAGNKLKGSIPTYLGRLANLNILKLDSNRLSGSIPSHLGRLARLTNLNLYNNWIKGEIPPHIGNMTLLSKLYIDNNMISGSLPWQIGNLSSLSLLYADDNAITGTVPRFFRNLRSLRELYLDDNDMTGGVNFLCRQMYNLEVLTVDLDTMNCSCCDCC